MSDEKIYLSVVQLENGTLQVRDQDGRVVSGIRAISVDQAHDEVSQFTITALEYRNGRPFIPRARGK